MRNTNYERNSHLNSTISIPTVSYTHLDVYKRQLFLDSATQTYAYAREDGHEALVVGLNMSDEPRTLVVPYVERGTKITFELPPWTGDVASV